MIQAVIKCFGISTVERTEENSNDGYRCLFKALVNEDTLLPTQLFARMPERATFVADTNFVSETQKMFLILLRNILCPQQMFPSLRSQPVFIVAQFGQQYVRNNASSFTRAFIRPVVSMGKWSDVSELYVEDVFVI